jgi:hypothetical protein
MILMLYKRSSDRGVDSRGRDRLLVFAVRRFGRFYSYGQAVSAGVFDFTRLSGMLSDR